MTWIQQLDFSRLFWISKLILILLLGMGLFQLLTYHSLWHDEAVSIKLAEQGWMTAWNFRKADYNPPLFDLALIPILKLAGTSETSARSLSALSFLGMLAIALFAFSKRNFFSVCLFLLFITSYALTRLTLEARPYIPVCFAATLGILFLLQRLRTPQVWNFSDLLKLSLLLSVLNYLHYNGIFFSAAVTISLLIWRQHFQLRWREWLLLPLLQLAIYLPWLPTLWRHAQKKPKWLLWESNPLLFDLERVAYFFFGSPFASLIFVVLSLCVLVFARRKDPLIFRTLLVVHSLWVIPLALTFFTLHIYSPGTVMLRHLTEIVPAILIAIGLNLEFIYKRHRMGGTVLALILITMAAQNTLNRKGWTQNSGFTDERKVAKHILSFNHPCFDVIGTERMKAIDFYLKQAGITQPVITPEQTTEKFANSDCPIVFLLKEDADLKKVKKFADPHESILSQQYKIQEQTHVGGYIVEQWKSD